MRQMRRKDREITDITEIAAILENCEVARLGLTDGVEAYIVPLNFALERTGDTLTLYFHSATEGRKVELLRKSGRVCVEADRLIRTEGGREACSWTAKYESVIGYGTVRFLEGAAKSGALDRLMERYGFEGKPEYSDESLARVCVCALELDSVSGKRSV